QGAAEVASTLSFTGVRHAPSEESGRQQGRVLPLVLFGSVLSVACTHSTSSDQACAAARQAPPGGWWRPQPATSWQWQLSGAVDESVEASMFDYTADIRFEVITDQQKVWLCRAIDFIQSKR